MADSTMAARSQTPTLPSDSSINRNKIRDQADSEKGVQREEAKVQEKEAPAAPSAAPQLGRIDAGRDAWLNVVGGWFLLFISFGWLNTVGILQTYYEEQALTNYSSSDISWIASTEIFFFFLGGTVSGKLFDSYGPRPLLLVGGFLHVFGIMMLSLGTEYYQFFLAQSVCSAWGASAVSFASLLGVSTWFVKRRALALGIITSGSSLGGVVFPIMVSRLVPMVGFGWAIRAIGFVILGLLLIGIPLTTSRLKHVPSPVHLMEFIRPFAEVPFLLLALASFFFYFTLFLPINYIELQGLSEGMTPNLASYLIPILNAGSLFGRVLPPYLGDKFGRFNSMIVITVFSAIIVFALWIPGYGAAAIIVFAALYGFASGAFIALLPALVAQISEIKQIGVRNGANYAFLSITTLIGNPIGGALIGDDNGSFLYMQIFTGVSMAVGAAFFIASRVSKTGVKWSKF